MLNLRLISSCGLCLLALAGACAEDDGDGTDLPEGGAEDDGDGTDLPEGCDQLVEPSDDDQSALAEAFVDAEDGSTICLAAGTFKPTRELLLTVNDATLRGAGIDDTTLDFAGQQTGGNGVAIKGNGVTLEAFQVSNTPGDGIRADQVENITFSKVRVAWDALHSLENGAYGLYPVQATGVVIRECEVIGARDAGIYVGQSTNIIVEDSIAHDNVAGIEIENSTDAQVRRNRAYDNTAGILVFNLPGLDIKNGVRANVYDNDIYDNNTVSFADAGTVVGKVPPGTGMLLLAADRTEIHDNRLTNNLSTGIAIIGYTQELVDLGIFEAPNDPEYDVWSEGNYIHDNTFEGNGLMPDPLVQALAGNMSPTPDIIVDGCADPEKDAADPALKNCVGEAATTRFMNADVCGKPTMVSTDTEQVACTQPALPTD
ncbi:MAG: right-handed parallel beta-helix repeat-containing protein [Deltaproteobacteria bacterium]|nr:right-handed parallel beta-helix repeat-containing protein [Nannocystaceae bacterium]